MPIDLKVNGKITIDGGKVAQSHFADYPILRMREAPPVEVHVIQTDVAPSGLGEPAPPPVAPTLCSDLRRNRTTNSFAAARQARPALGLRACASPFHGRAGPKATRIRHA